MGNVKYPGAEFTVTPAELRRSAEVMGKAAEKAKKELARLSDLSEQTSGCFQGKAGEAFRSAMKELAVGWQELLDGLHNNAVGLEEIAEEYEKAEGDNVNVSVGNTG